MALQENSLNQTQTSPSTDEFSTNIVNYSTSSTKFQDDYKFHFAERLSKQLFSTERNKQVSSIKFQRGLQKNHIDNDR